MDTIAAAPTSFIPQVPRTIAETGLSAGLIEHLISNTLYSRGAMTGRAIADVLGIGFSAIEVVISDLKARQSVEVKGSEGFGLATSLFALSEAGRRRAREYFEINQYVGPAPVPLDVYRDAVARQRLLKGWLTKERLDDAYKGSVIEPEVLEQIGPAANSGKSLLIYGKPGNGKTYMAEALLNLLNVDIFIPYAVEYNGTITQIFDALYHKRSTTDEFSRTLFRKSGAMTAGGQSASGRFSPVAANSGSRCWNCVSIRRRKSTIHPFM